MTSAQRRSVAALVGGGAVLLLADCHDPTEITLALKTDVPCADWRGARISVASPTDAESSAPRAVTTVCDASGILGTLVVVPSGGLDDALVVRIVGGDGRLPETCVPPAYGAGCIVERRRFRFIPRTPLHVTITLARACAGVACTPDQTCLPTTAQCTSSLIDAVACSGAGCDDSALIAPDGGTMMRPDGAIDDGAIADGATPADAVADGSPPVDAASDAVDTDAALGAIGASCTHDAQCAGGCCCKEIGFPLACDQRAACIAEANGCTP